MSSSTFKSITQAHSSWVRSIISPRYWHFKQKYLCLMVAAQFVSLPCLVPWSRCPCYNRCLFQGCCCFFFCLKTTMSIWSWCIEPTIYSPQAAESPSNETEALGTETHSAGRGSLHVFIFIGQMGQSGRRSHILRVKLSSPLIIVSIFKSLQINSGRNRCFAWPYDFKRVFSNPILCLLGHA